METEPTSNEEGGAEAVQPPDIPIEAPPGDVIEGPFVPGPRPRPLPCDKIERGVNRQLAEKCANKANHLKPANDEDPCPCSAGGGSGASNGVDLIVLVDVSSSMLSAVRAIDAAAPRALEIAKEMCAAKANVTYLYVDTFDVGSSPFPAIGVFTESHEQNLIRTVGATGPFSGDGDGTLWDTEQGARAIVDLSNHYDWIDGYCRAILYVSDERLDSYDKTVADSLTATNLAIAAANDPLNNVTVFTHFVANSTQNRVPPGHPDRPIVAGHYQALATQTGGTARIDGINPAVPTVITEELYVEILSDAICGGCGSGKCETAEFPELHPCVTVSWGDSECDCMEGDDHEELCVTVCNCYDNVTFRNVKISALFITDSAGNPPPRLPDGSPSSEIYPLGPICFGDIGPCSDGEASCVSRNAMIINRGLPPGTWTVRVRGLCFDVTHHYDEFEHTFELEVCKN